MNCYLLHSIAAKGTLPGQGWGLTPPAATTSQDGASTVPSVGNTTAPTSPIAEEEDAEEYEDAEEVSDSDDNEDDEEVKSIPSMVSIPFLSAERKQQLLEAIVQARKEWRNTSSRVRVLQVVEEVNAGK